MRLIMKEVLIMILGGSYLVVNPHYLHTLLHDVIMMSLALIMSPPKFIMSISVIMSLIMTLLVFQCRWADRM